ncbi:MAG: hypothetical protein QM622_00670 [Microbacterium sp.]
MRRLHRRQASFTAVVAIAAGLLFSACAPSPTPSGTRTPSTTVSATPAPTSTGPGLVPDGTAADNLPLFAEVMNQVYATKKKAKGRAYIDALVAAGFDKDAMEVTNDRTSVDNPADSIQFSVLWKGECLVGQVGPSIEEPTALVMPEVPGGTCLIGETRPIDW